MKLEFLDTNISIAVEEDVMCVYEYLVTIIYNVERDIDILNDSLL